MKFFQSISTCVLALSSIASAASFTNPLRKSDGADPHISWSGGYYYMMTTTWTNLSITRAKTLGGLKTGETKVVWTDTNANRCCNMWAPELQYIDGAWYIYYTAGRNGADNLDLQRPYVLKGMYVHLQTWTGHSHTHRWRHPLRQVHLPRATSHHLGHRRQHRPFQCPLGQPLRLVLHV
jgi:beta-xylosidase